MSEQTPDTESGMAEAQEPSMEDILASIRKIIAEDDIQTSAALENTVEVVAEIMPEAESVTGDVAELQPMETLDLDIITDDTESAVELDIEALIGDKDAASSDDIEPADISEQALVDEPLEDILELEIPMDETETLAEVEIVEAVDSNEDDLSLMLDDMLEENVSYAKEPAELTEETVIDSTEDLIAEDVSDEDILVELELAEDMPDTLPESVPAKSDPDIDLVKSLMADLTEEPLHDEAELSDVEDAEIELDTVEASESESESEAETEAEAEVANVDSSFDIEDEASQLDDETEVSSDDILEEILSVTIDDEEKLLEEIAIPDIREAAHAESLSLKDIAAAAEADAQASEAGLPASVVTGLGAAAIGGVVAATQNEEAPEEEQSEVDIDTIQEDIPDNDDVDSALSKLDELLAEESSAERDTLTPEPIIEETPEMPRAKKTDAIIDEVTETASAGAFASLNQVVEEKATVAERGDRIGDLVQEALRPMLKEWLDANLKGIVERAVTKEVKRISSGK